MSAASIDLRAVIWKFFTRPQVDPTEEHPAKLRHRGFPRGVADPFLAHA